MEQDLADEAKEKRKEAAKLKADDQAKWEREAYEDALKRESENIDSEGWWCGIAVFVLKQKR